MAGHRSTLPSIDDHFWDWMLWLTTSDGLAECGRLCEDAEVQRTCG